MNNKVLKFQEKISSEDTQLLLATKKKHKSTVENLMNAGVNVNCSQCQNNNTVLHCAAENGWLEIVQALLKKGADIQVKTASGDSALILAAKEIQIDIVKFLIDGGADINCTYSLNGYTVLHYASQNGWVEIVWSLQNKSGDIQVKTEDGITPLFLAAENGHGDIFEFLLNAGADVNCSNKIDYTVLHYASKYGWFEIVPILLEKGLDIQGKSKCGESPLLLAARNRHKDIVKLFVNAGADINCYESHNQNNIVLHYASVHGWLEIVQFLLKQGTDIEVKTEDGVTSLYLAAENGHRDIFEYLLNAGADINSSNNRNNYTVLHYSSRNGWLDIVHSLLKKGANIEAKTSRGETSLQLACRGCHVEVAEHLINSGANVNAKSNNGSSALSQIIWILHNIKLPGYKLIHPTHRIHDLKLVCPLLIERGAFLNVVDYKRIENSFLKEYILQDIELCSQVIINEFNNKDLPELYKQSMACKILPCIEEMKIGSNSQAAHEVLHCVKQEIQVRGHCNVLEVRPKVLKMFSVKSIS